MSPINVIALQRDDKFLDGWLSLYRQTIFVYKQPPGPSQTFVNGFDTDFDNRNKMDG